MHCFSKIHFYCLKPWKQYKEMQISPTFNLIWEHSDQVFSISHNLAYCSLAKVLISGGHPPPSMSVVEKGLAMKWLPSKHPSSSVRMRKKLLLGMTGLKFIPYSYIFHQFAGDQRKDTNLKSCLFSGFGCQSQVVEEESLSQMVTKVRTHPLLFSSCKHNLCTKIKYKAGFVSLPFFNK